MAEKKQAELVRVRMLGNMWDYENGKEYDLPAEKANQLTGLGMAVVVEPKEGK